MAEEQTPEDEVAPDALAAEEATTAEDEADASEAGGDLASNDSADAAISSDGGQTWTLTTKPPTPGTIFCLSYARGVGHQRGNPAFERTVVVTAETAPNFNSGSAAWPAIAPP